MKTEKTVVTVVLTSDTYYSCVGCILEKSGRLVPKVFATKDQVLYRSPINNAEYSRKIKTSALAEVKKTLKKKFGKIVASDIVKDRLENI